MSHFGKKHIAHVVGDPTDQFFISGTPTDFTYRIDLPKNNLFNRVAVIHANLNKSWYVVESNKNTFTLTEENGSSSAIVTIPVGNYTKTTFINTLPTILNNASPNGYTYTMTYSDVTGKYTYTCVGHTLQSAFVFAGDERVHKQMGFDNDSTNTFTAGTLTSSNVINFQFTNSILIRSDCVSDTVDNVLQEIGCGHIPYRATINWDASDLDLNSKVLKTNETNVFRFILTDGEHHILDLGGTKNSIHMTLVFYRRNDLHERQFHLIGSQLKEKLEMDE